MDQGDRMICSSLTFKLGNGVSPITTRMDIWNARVETQKNS